MKHAGRGAISHGGRRDRTRVSKTKEGDDPLLLTFRLDSAAMTEVDEYGRPEPPPAGDEVATLLGFLDFQRATLAWKCRGVDAAGLRSTVGVSTITLGGLLKHLAYVEDDWFSRWLYDEPRQPPWDTVDWAADPDWDWNSATDDSPDELFAVWNSAVSRSRSKVEVALPTAASDNWRVAVGRTAVHPACAGSWLT